MPRLTKNWIHNPFYFFNSCVMFEVINSWFFALCDEHKNLTVENENKHEGCSIKFYVLCLMVQNWISNPNQDHEVHQMEKHDFQPSHFSKANISDRVFTVKRLECVLLDIIIAHIVNQSRVLFVLCQMFDDSRLCANLWYRNHLKRCNCVIG